MENKQKKIEKIVTQTRVVNWNIPNEDSKESSSGDN